MMVRARVAHLRGQEEEEQQNGKGVPPPLLSNTQGKVTNTYQQRIEPDAPPQQRANKRGNKDSTKPITSFLFNREIPKKPS
jgi:hypothetical protein